jgi:hypothetical protein
MKTMTQYTSFVGNINELNAALEQASKEGKRPLLMNSESYIDGNEILKKRVTIYTVIFEQTVVAS